MDKSIKIFVPASSANLGAGFDVIGACLDIWNEIKIKCSDNFNFFDEFVTGFSTNILNPLLKENLPFTLSQKIVSTLRIFPISYPMIIPPTAGARIKSIFLNFFLILKAKDLQILSAK